MRSENVHAAIASEELILNDTVIIEDGKCRIPTFGESEGKPLSNFYCVMDLIVHIGEMAHLSGVDTVHHIELEVER